MSSGRLDGRVPFVSGGHQRRGAGTSAAEARLFAREGAARRYRIPPQERDLFGRPPYPTATGVIVAGLLREGTLIEISAVAVLPDGASDARAAAAALAPESAPPRASEGP